MDPYEGLLLAASKCKTSKDMYVMFQSLKIRSWGCPSQAGTDASENAFKLAEEADSKETNSTQNLLGHRTISKRTYIHTSARVNPVCEPSFDSSAMME